MCRLFLGSEADYLKESFCSWAGKCVGLVELPWQGLQTKWLTRILFPQFWSIEVREQAVGSVRFFWEPPPWLVGGHLHPMCVFCMRACVLISSSYKYKSHIGLGSTVMTLLYLNYLFKSTVSKYNYILRYWG